MPDFLASKGMLTIFARFLEILFVVGMIGSGVVVILAFVEDIRDFAAGDESKPKRSEDPERITGLAGAPNATLTPR
jgi:hypothetical protein